MQDFAYLFNDSAASWLEGRGDARFQKYESFYRASRAAAVNAETFDLEQSNEQYTTRCAQARSRLVLVLDSKPFKHAVVCFALMWVGSRILPFVGHSQPVGTGVLLVAVFVALRIKRRRARFRHLA
jgi:hypothetical protein